MDQLYSTRGQAPRVDLREAVFRGLPPDNGLYLPVEIPVLPDSFFAEIETLSFQEIAVRVALALLAGSLADEVIEGIVREAINFDAPLVEVAPDSHCLELFHGPSLAFKDFGARFMSRLMAYFLAEEAREINILVAT
nr:threonine synthase [Calditrichia bacterium]